MEALGAAASIVNLIQAIVTLSNTGRRVCLRYRNAPVELQRFLDELDALQSQLEMVRMVSLSGHPLLLTTKVNGDIERILKDANDAVLELDVESLRASDGTTIGNRLEWVRRTRKETILALERLHRVQQRIALQILIINLQASTLTLNQLYREPVSVASPSENQDRIQAPLCAQTKDMAVKSRRLNAPSWSFGSIWNMCGLSGNYLSTLQDDNVDFSIALRIDFPVSWIFGRYALLISLTLQQSLLLPNTWVINAGRIAVARTLQDNDPYLMACRCGDVQLVRAMLKTGQGRIIDVDRNNGTPMKYAIESGNVEIVQELINFHADVNEPFGVSRTSPLQWAVWKRQFDICRFLLANGASQDHINIQGNSIVPYCWASFKRSEASMVEYLRLLAEYAPQELDTVDVNGWTSIARAAAFGTPEDMSDLVRFGADPLYVSELQGWNALQYAVFYGNLATFESLLSTDGNGLDLVDRDGWSLLHIAALGGNAEMMHHLLSLGADPYLTSRNFVSDDPDVLFGRACTPREVAAGQGPDVEQAYLQALQDCGLFHDAIASVNDAQAEETDIFWDATEHLQSGCQPE